MIRFIFYQFAFMQTAVVAYSISGSSGSSGSGYINHEIDNKIYIYVYRNNNQNTDYRQNPFQAWVYFIMMMIAFCVICCGFACSRCKL